MPEVRIVLDLMAATGTAQRILGPPLPRDNKMALEVGIAKIALNQSPQIQVLITILSGQR
jgi:hypothetical protein